MKKGSSAVIIKSALTVIVLLAFTTLASAHGAKKRIQFPRGSNSTTIAGSVLHGKQNKYLIGAREGQTMTVRITSPENNAVFQIYFPGEQESLQGAGDGDDAKDWKGKLISTTDYVIVVGTSRGNADYKLDVKIQ